MSPVFAHGQLRLYLLDLLEQGPRYGYEVIQDLEQRFNGLYTPSAGTVYPRLAKLEQEGLVARTDEGRKATYRITEAGRAEVAARRGDLADLHDDLERSVRELAQEVRDRVQGQTADLRAELKAAARAARAGARPAGRAASSSASGPTSAAPGTPPGTPPSAPPGPTGPFGASGPPGATGPSDWSAKGSGGWPDLERAMADVHSQARGGWGTRGLTPGQISEVLAILSEASTRIREVVSRGH